MSLSQGMCLNVASFLGLLKRDIRALGGGWGCCDSGSMMTAERHCDDTCRGNDEEEDA